MFIIEKINLSNFNIKNVTDMNGMFSECSLLKEINLSNYSTNNVKDMGCISYGCSNKVKMKIKSQMSNIKQEGIDTNRNIHRNNSSRLSRLAIASIVIVFFVAIIAVVYNVTTFK